MQYILKLLKYTMGGHRQWMDNEHTIPLQSNFRILTSSTPAFPRGTRGFEISLQADWTQLVVWRRFFFPYQNSLQRHRGQIYDIWGGRQETLTCQISYIASMVVSKTLPQTSQSLNQTQCKPLVWMKNNLPEELSHWDTTLMEHGANEFC